jgi:hypothetical protein
MKAGVALMVELGLELAQRAGSVAATLCFFAREELPFGDSSLTPLLAATSTCTAPTPRSRSSHRQRAARRLSGNLHATDLPAAAAGAAPARRQRDRARDRRPLPRRRRPRTSSTASSSARSSRSRIEGGSR